MRGSWVAGRRRVQLGGAADVLLLALDAQASLEPLQRLVAEERGRAVGLPAIACRTERRAVFFRGLGINGANHHHACEIAR